LEAAVVPNGVDVKRFKPCGKAVARRRTGLGVREKVVLTAGRLSFEKNVDVVLKAFALVLRQEGSARLVVTGGGPAERECKRLAVELGVGNRVSFPGFVGEGLLPAYYSAADVFVTASTFETQGLSLLEAMACGTPVVGANALAIPEAVDCGRNGFLFEPGDVDGCARELLKVLGAGGARRKSWSAAARRKALEFSLPKAVDALERVYESVGRR